MSITPKIYIDGAEDDHLIPISIDHVMAPAINTITVQRKTGKVNGTQEPFDINFTTIPYVDLRGKELKVELQDDSENDDTILGVIIEDSQVINGVDSEGVRLSTDTYIAYGYEYYLNKNVIQNSIEHGPTTINRALPFNLISDSGERIGNRYDGPEPYTFANSITEELNVEWTGRTVVLYLLEHFKNKYGYNFSLAGNAGILNALDNIKGAWTAHGKTYWQLLNEIINPKYGFCFYVDGDTTESLEIVVNTVVATVTGTVPGNSSKVTVDLASSHNLEDVNMKFMDDSYFGKIIMRGGRYVFTNTFYIDQFEESWTTEDKDDYNNSETTDKQRRELKKEGIFTKFFIKPIDEWDGKIDEIAAFPVIDPINETISPTENQDIYFPTFKFLGNLAVRKDGQALQPFAFMDHVEKGNQRLDNPSEGSGIDLYILPDRAGIQFRPRIPHLIAGEEFDSENAETDIDVEYDYKTMAATLSYMSDDFMEVPYVIDANIKTEKIIEEPSLKISVVLNGTFLPDEIVSATYFNENGLPQLKALGEMAKAWYGKKKHRLSFNYPDGKIAERIGQLVTTASIGSQDYDINTIISRVTYNFTYGQNRGSTTSISTEFKDIDLKNILGTNTSKSSDQATSDIAELKQKVANLPNKLAVNSPGAGAPTMVIIPRSVDGDDYTADLVKGFIDQTPIKSVLARIGNGDTSNNQAPIDNPYAVENIEEDGEDTVYIFQPPVAF